MDEAVKAVTQPISAFVGDNLAWFEEQARQRAQMTPSEWAQLSQRARNDLLSALVQERLPRLLVQVGISGYGLSLDRGKRECQLRGVKISLSSMEFKLLELLVERAGTPVSTQSIIETVWPKGHVTPKIVATLMERLRRRLNISPNELILAVPGVGYKVDI